ncbi:MAG TPA: molybdopterin converting factor subunit 1 [Quisquiliibacterium sp.]|nr:molybdopterin converting factor subunit 1 [Quisquiliibacterium sp.]
MSVTIRYFASLREAVGVAHEQIDLPPGVHTAGALRAWLRGRGPVWAEALAETRAVRVAVDQVSGDADTAVRDGAEVAYFPPVTGG